MTNDEKKFLCSIDWETNSCWKETACVRTAFCRKQRVHRPLDCQLLLRLRRRLRDRPRPREHLERMRSGRPGRGETTKPWTYRSAESSAPFAATFPFPLERCTAHGTARSWRLSTTTPRPVKGPPGQPRAPCLWSTWLDRRWSTKLNWTTHLSHSAGRWLSTTWLRWRWRTVVRTLRKIPQPRGPKNDATFRSQEKTSIVIVLATKRITNLVLALSRQVTVIV